MPKRLLTGRVKSDKMSKTRVVQIPVKVIEKSTEVDLAAVRAARKQKEQLSSEVEPEAEANA